ncbi:alpha/beta hydrolase [Georgenia yuyongxinii]|uniref:Alpha/beta hydrolase n=1 Tax=Georgenia yuyongxinii TaxID=2589797 RepID=A0A5B8C3C9_9MICO|nr:alpha/beta hydrolase [Georgenia yuyongxinii]QDC25239.1 alpha/beta hydrolase [Georgenia yuyongxinii]
MTTFVIVHGAGGSGWEWHRVAGELRGRGHDVVAPDLPCEDETAGLAEYADTVVAAVQERARTAPGRPSPGEGPARLVVVAHSLGGFTAPQVAERLGADRLVLVAGMVPLPGETGGQWWETSGYQRAARERADRDGVVARMDTDEEVVATFMHDLEPALTAEALQRGRDQAGRPMSDPWPLTAWPDVPTSYLIFGDDRFFPPEFLRRMVRERLGIDADEMPGSHAAYLSRPAELAERLVAYAGPTT